MIEMLFAAALMDTVIAVPAEGTVYVHEWGVVTFMEQGMVLCSDPEAGQLWEAAPPHQWESEMVVRAPVVYFYGEPFTGEFVVRAGSADFIETWPEPASMTEGPNSAASWSITGTSYEAERELTAVSTASACIPPELLELWGQPPSMILEFEDGNRESFIYYECSLPSEGTGNLYPVEMNEGRYVLTSSYDGPQMTFVRNGGSVVMTGGDGNDVIDTLCGWAGGTMKSQELRSMWDTWSDWIYQGDWEGDYLLVFPLPGTTVSGITGIELITDDWMDVNYSRFFLGIITGDGQP